MDVLVIGAIGMDVKGRVAAPLQMGTSNSGAIRRSPGGVARNVAENLARLGVETMLISAVGDDWTGRYVLEETRLAGVDVSHVAVLPGARSGTYLALQDEERRLVVGLDDMTILDAITPRYVNDRRRLFRGHAMVVVDANLSPETLKTVFRLAEQYSCPVCVDPTSTQLALRLRPFLGQLCLATPSLAEAGALLGDARAGERPIDLARRLVSRGVRLVVITLAEQGLCYATAEESGHMPAVAVPIADRTGVGDALTAAVVFGLLERVGASEAVRLGLSAAALTLQCQETVCRDLNLERLYEQLVI